MNMRKLFWRNPVPIHTHPRVAEVVDDDVVAVVAVSAGVVEGAGHELVAGVPRRRHVEAGAAGDINCYSTRNVTMYNKMSSQLFRMWRQLATKLHRSK